jgi:hypothetical protein
MVFCEGNPWSLEPTGGRDHGGVAGGGGIGGWWGERAQ